MSHQLPELPYSQDALAPVISAETLEYHHGKHHNAYVQKLNGMIEGTDHANTSLDDLVKKAEGGMFNQAAQIWNHTFYWNCMTPGGSGVPGSLEAMIKSSFGSMDALKERFLAEAAGHFGSGWAWIVKTKEGKLDVVSTHDAGCPLRDGLTPVLTADVWEHAYYIDYRNARPKYLEAWWGIANWEFAASQAEG